LGVEGGELITAASTAYLFDTSVTTLNVGSAATTLNLAGGSGSTGCTINSSGDLTCSGSLVTTASSAALFNTNATTLDIGGAATTLTLAGGSGSTGCSINSSGNLTCSGTLTAGSSQAFVQNGNSLGASAVLGTNDSNSLAFETAGTTQMTILTTGLVGIGDSTPDDLLNIHSASAAASLALTSLGTDTDASIKFELADGTPSFTIGVDDSDNDQFKISTTALGTGDMLVINSSGNVGIGDSSPSSMLDVDSTNSTANVSVDGTNVALTDSGDVTSGSRLKRALFAGTSGSGTYSGGNAHVQAAYFDVETTTGPSSSGSLFVRGIEVNARSTSGSTSGSHEVTGGSFSAHTNLGTTGTTEHVGVGVSASNTADTNYGLRVYSVTDATTNYGVYINTVSGGTNYQLYSAGTADSYFAGNLGVGEVTPLYPLDVAHAAATDTYIARFFNDGGDDGDDGLIVQGCADSNPTSACDFTLYSDGDGTTVGSVAGDGAGGVAFNQTSDVRLKENIVDYSGALDLVNAMQVRTFNFITSPDKSQIGFIAQELADVVPQVVSVGGDDPEKSPWMVDYGKLTPVLAGAIQELYQLVLDENGSVTSNSTGQLLDMAGYPITGIHALESISGLWSISDSGDLSTSTVTAEKYAVRVTDERESIARGTVYEGTMAAVIENPEVHENSEIFITFRGNPGGPWYISEQHEGMFILQLMNPVGQDVPFTYWIVDVVDERTPEEEEVIIIEEPEAPPAEEEVVDESSGEESEESAEEEQPVEEQPPAPEDDPAVEETPEPLGTALNNLPLSLDRS
jgi:hypothetical protein